MILSFPIDAWLLLFVAVGLGLGLELAFYRARRADRAAEIVGERGPEAPRRAAAPEEDG